MTDKELRKIGGKIHEILNETIYRKLTRKEYEKLVVLIAKVMSDL